MVSAFSVPKSKRDYKYNDSPGPGNYNPQSSPKIIKQSDPKYSFGKQSRKHPTSYVPGPGSYQIRQKSILDKTPSYSILGRNQMSSKKLDVGPGQYQPHYGIAKQKSPSYSMKGRSHSTIQYKPGPGQYEPKINNFEKNGGAFSKDSRNQAYQTKVPGPGSYQYQNAVFKYGSKKQPSYGFGSRIQMKSTSFAPGPGQYQPKKQNYSKIGGIISRDMHNSMVFSKTPGPGSYDQLAYNKLKSKDPQWSMSKSSRDQISNSNPLGPGQYEADKVYKSVIQSSQKSKFGTQKRLNEYNNKIPGPGSYQQNLIKSRMSIKIGQKQKDLSSSYVPGPGQYQQNKYDNQAWLKGQGRYSMGKSLRDVNDRTQVPGPGAYDSLGNRILDPKGKITFGKDPRNKLDDNRNPGPGHYTLKPTFADVPKYLLPDKN